MSNKNAPNKKLWILLFVLLIFVPPLFGIAVCCAIVYFSAKLFKKIFIFVKTQYKKLNKKYDNKFSLILWMIFFWPVALYRIALKKAYLLKSKWFLFFFTMSAFIMPIIIFGLIFQTGRARPLMHGEWDKNIFNELDRDYFINISPAEKTMEGENYQELYFDCNLEISQTDKPDLEKYQGEKSTYTCKIPQISGEYSSYDSVSFEHYGNNFSVQTDNNNFMISVPKKTFSSSDWYSNLDLNKSFDVGKITLSLKNKILNYDTMSKKVVRVFYRLTEEDKKILDSQISIYKSYRAEQERISAEKREQERIEKEREEAEKAEQERQERERQEAEKAEREREEQERQEQERLEREQQEQQEYQEYQEQESSSSSGSSSSGSYSPSSGVTDAIYGYCNDGTYVYGSPSARGKANACYGHKGWRDY